MLDFKKYLNRVKKADPDDVSEINHLRVLLEGYGQAGVDSLVNIVLDDNQTDEYRCHALVVLGVHRASFKRGTVQCQNMLEAACFAKDAPTLVLLAFHGVYGNAIMGKVEAAQIVEQFRSGTPAQQETFKRTDAEYTRSANGIAYINHLRDTGTLN